ncbi:hypothetical protein LTR08_007371 [Meristemomyces frigidus]|nr:hypothetical protein LTR08_007371 [Meristemomyces frigidus]
MPTTRSQTAQERESIASSNVPSQAASADSGIRQRQQVSSDFLTNDTEWANSRPRTTVSDEPPRFTIDLSLPPEERYLEVCAALHSEITGITSLFDEVVGGMVGFLPLKWLHVVCRLLLRGLYSEEETAELRGIGEATGVALYLLVCLNVLLDLFMGCSSGGAAVKGEDGSATILHFRTLDWGMPALRRIVVRLDFVTEAGGGVVASSVTYAGFVGVLTGVRSGFSVSLNFRPQHDGSGGFGADARYGWHLLLVLLGWRASISSTLRTFLLPKRQGTNGEVSRTQARAGLDLQPDHWVDVAQRTAPGRTVWSAMTYADVLKQFCTNGRDTQCNIFPSTACYLCICDGDETTVIEKDLVTARIRSSDDFIVITNNDEDDAVNVGGGTAKEEPPFATALAEIVLEAKDRKQCAEHNWNNIKVVKAKALRLRSPGKEERKLLLDFDDVVTLVQRYPTTNEATHFACVMDPGAGSVRWCRRWMRPVSAKWIREHQSETW